MNTFKPRRSVLPAAQSRLWPALRPAAQLGFVLYGGTAIALRLGHRSSVDFDFFNEKSLDRRALADAFPFLRTATVLQDERETFTLTVPGRAGPVKLSFFGRIDFGRFAEPEFTDDGVHEVASRDDLLATELKTILQRAESKDYRDIAALLAAGTDLPRGLAIAREMFRPTFQPAISLKALTWHEGGDLASLPAKARRSLIAAASAVRELPTVTRLSARLSAARPTGRGTRSKGKVGRS